MTSATEWQLEELFARFPEVSRGTDRVLRCLWRISGEGRYVEEKAGVRLSATVSLTARPGQRFVLRLSNSWPKALCDSDRQVIESELLRGILEGTVACEDPPWRCQIECSSVDWSPAGQGGTLVRAAASLAVQDLVKGGGWEAVGSPGDHVA
jgi:hypothetical protein